MSNRKNQGPKKITEERGRKGEGGKKREKKRKKRGGRKERGKKRRVKRKERKGVENVAQHRRSAEWLRRIQRAEGGGLLSA